MKTSYKVVEVAETYKGFTSRIVKTYSRLSSAERFVSQNQDSTPTNIWYQIVECDNQ